MLLTSDETKLMLFARVGAHGFSSEDAAGS
jgi:hypothetical protein